MVKIKPAASLGSTLTSPETEAILPEAKLALLSSRNIKPIPFAKPAPRASILTVNFASTNSLCKYFNSEFTLLHVLDKDTKTEEIENLGDNLDDAVLQWRDESAVTVVLAAQGYPESPKTGSVVSSIPTIDKSQVFHAGTTLNGGSLLSTGGRVLTVTGTGSDLTEARDRAYRAISQIELEGSFYRSDIALNASVAEKGN